MEGRDGVEMWNGATGIEGKQLGLWTRLWDGLDEVRSDVEDRGHEPPLLHV